MQTEETSPSEIDAKVVSTASYSYTTGDMLVVMEETELIAEASIFFAEEYSRRAGPSIYGGSTWTHDGRFSAIITDDESTNNPADRSLVVVDAHTGEIERLPCANCWSIAPVGGGQIIATVNPEETAGVLVFDLSNTDPPINWVIPDEYASILGPSTYLVLQGGMEGVALLASAGEDYAYFLVHENGEIEPIDINSRLAEEYNDIYVFNPAGLLWNPTAFSQPDDGNSHLAITTNFNHQDAPADSCGASNDVFITQLDSETANKTDTSSVYPSGHTPALDSYLSVLDLWWSRDQNLHAVMAVGSCPNSAAGGADIQRPTEWRLQDDQWVQVTDDPVLAVRELDDGARLVRSGAEDSFGALYLETPDGMQEIAPDVLSIDVPAV